ncbi:MAG: protein kinase [Acidobacteriota bacterium]
MNELKLDPKVIAGRYRLHGRISSGSYAEIFVATDLQNNGRYVAIKALNAQLQGTTESDLEKTLAENFEKEASILKSISHPNILSLIDHGEAEDLLNRRFRFIVLEYMSGGDLLDLTRKNPNGGLSLGQTLNYFRQIFS